MNSLLPYKIIAGALLMAALSFGVHHFLEHERDIGRAEVRALWDAQIAKDKEAARIETDRLATQSAEAAKNGANREQTIRTLAAAAGNANIGLRDTLANVRSNVPGATIEALGKSVATLSTVFADCAGKYQEMAVIADRHASDTRTLEEAWPTAPAK